MTSARKRSHGSASGRSAPAAVILVSGGLDSSACVAFYQSQSFAITGLFIDYRQPALEHERTAARKVARHFGIELREIKLRGLGAKCAGEVRGRNAVFMFTALMEHPIAQGVIALGIHAGPPYYDCTPAFLNGMQVLFDGYTNGRIKAAAPFVRMTKEEVWRFGQSAGLPMEITYSCERGGKIPCGRCASCCDRKKLNVVPHY
jgi:7-cyano-7-deazaguanine synthase